MTVYTGFQPGTYQPWAINLHQNALGRPGIVRGLQVTQTGAGAASVTVTVDPIALDGVCYLANGCWARIDANLTLTINTNTSGSTRTDAVIATVDPTGVGQSGITVSQGWTTNFTPGTNQYVIALVTVPNNFVTILNSNILMNVAVASIGNAPTTVIDAVAGETNLGDSQPLGIFVAYNIQLAGTASNGQTIFNVPLGGLQRLVPAGKIGGAMEVGYFAGPNGWYWPKVMGSVSGYLTVTSLDTVNNNIIAIGAQTGETISVSYKYYDFNQDLQVRAGQRFVEATSPYLVYQGDFVREALLGTQYNLFEGTQGALSCYSGNGVIYYTDFNYSIDVCLLDTPVATNYSVSVDNGAPNNYGASGVPVPGSEQQTSYLHAGTTGSGVHVYVIQSPGFALTFGGLRSIINLGGSVFVSGGAAVVNGHTVFATTTSMLLPAPTGGMHATYTVWLDQFGNISTAGGVAASNDRVLGRIPVSSALGYGSRNPGTSASYGTWALTDGYMGVPVEVALTTRTQGVAYAGLTSGWKMVADPKALTGYYAQSNNTADSFHLHAVCTGLEGLFITGSNLTTALQVRVDNITNYLVYVPGNFQYDVRTVLSTGWPYGSHVFSVEPLNGSGNAQIGFDAMDVRVPALPMPPNNTLSLAQVDTFGQSSFIRYSMVRGTDLFNGRGNTDNYYLDGTLNNAGPALFCNNLSSNFTFATTTVEASGAYRVHYVGGADTGIFTFGHGVGTTPLVYTVDSYAAGGRSNFILGPIYSGFDARSISFSTSGSKNASSTSTQVIINAVDVVPPYVNVTDTRRLGFTGTSPTIRGSGIFGARGERFQDATYGIRAAHIQDRNVTSRKHNPAWNRVISTTAYSGFPSTDPFMNCGITVDVPSILVANFLGSLHVPAGGSDQGFFYLDYQVYEQTPCLNIANGAGSVQALNAGMSDFLLVTPGNHTVTVFFQAFGGAQPYFDNGSQRQLTLWAFAL